MSQEQNPIKFGKPHFICPHCGGAAAFSHHDLGEKLGECTEDQRPEHHGGPSVDARLLAGEISDLTRGITFSFCLCGKKERLIWLDGKLIHPVRSPAPQAAGDMPPEVRAAYDEAAKVSAASPRAAAALLRLAFESLLKGIWRKPHVQEALAGKGGDGEKLALGNRVQLLYDAHLLSPSAHKMAKTVHLVGNEASHEPGQIQAEEKEELVPPAVPIPQHTCGRVDHSPATSGGGGGRSGKAQE